MSDHRIVALIPARGGSIRVKRKNVRKLGNHPLLAYTIAAAQQSGVFEEIYVSTEDREIEQIALRYGADVVIRPAKYATSESPDIEWVRHALVDCHIGDGMDDWALLRPTSPFRSAAAIRRAWHHWRTEGQDFDSLRAVERVSQHPGKCWLVVGDELAPFHTFGLDNPPSHSRATQSLPPVYIQTASLEMAHVRTVVEKNSISGDRIMPFFDGWPDSHDLNSEVDWLVAETMLDRGLATLPEVS